MPPPRQPAVTGLRWSLALAVAGWVVADLLRWLGDEAPDSAASVAAHVVHMGADVLLVVAVWLLGRVQRPVRRPDEGIEAALILLGVTVPAWLLWIRPNVATAANVTAGGTTVLALHLLLVLVVLGTVVWYLVGDVWIDRQDEVIRGALVVLVLTDVGPPFPGGADPEGLVVALEVVRLGLAAALATAVWVFPSVVMRRAAGRRQWQPDRLRLVTWAIVALVGPVVLAGGVMAGARDLHALAVAAVATVVGVVLLALREWTVIADAGQVAGREQRRADRQARLARRLSRREEARTTFLSAASHDLRTPLMAVKGSAELLAGRYDRLDDERRKMLATTVVRNADRLQHLLESLLDVERLTSGTIRARRERVEVHEVVARVVDGIHLRDAPIEMVPGPSTARVDPLLLERILDNLLTNAVRHTPPGTAIQVAWARLDDGGLQLTVSDAGPGIPERERARLLEAFTRLERSVETPGSGLGLSLVSGFARLHGGTVAIGDRPGGGARFVVDLPAGRAPSPSTPGPDVGDAPAGAPPDEDRWRLAEPLGAALDRAMATSVDDEQVVDRAVRLMLQATSVDQLVGILVAVVRHLGGLVVGPSSESRPGTLAVDLSLGEGPPVVPAAPPTDPVRRRLRAHVPALVEDARRLAALLRAQRRTATGRGVVDALEGDDDTRRARFLAWAAEGRVTDCIDLACGLVQHPRDGAAVVVDLLRWVQHEAGGRWQDGSWSVADEHVVTSVVDATLGALEREVAPDGSWGRVAVVCPPGEWHVTPARLAALTWRAAGWEVSLLGAAVPTEAVRRHLDGTGVRALVVSSTLPWVLPAARPLVAAAHEAGVPVLLGGAGTTSHRAGRVGADAWASDPDAAVTVLDRWRDRPPELAGPPVPAPVDPVAGRRHRLVDTTVEVLVGRLEPVVDGSAGFRGDVDMLLRSACAAVQVDDPRLLADVAAWARGTTAVRGVPATLPDAAIEELCQVLPDDVEPVRRLLAEQLDAPTSHDGGDRTTGPPE